MNAFYAVDQQPDGLQTSTIRHFKAFFMPHKWFACFKGPWQAVLAVFWVWSIFKLFWPQFLWILLAIARDSVNIQMSTVPHFKA